jgi:hypothetical protein
MTAAAQQVAIRVLDNVVELAGFAAAKPCVCGRKQFGANAPIAAITVAYATEHFTVMRVECSRCDRIWTRIQRSMTQIPQ